MQVWTIQKLLNWITEYLEDKGVESARLNTELLLSYVLKMKRIELYTNFDKIITKPHLDKLHNLVDRAGQQEPIAYITGKAEFYSLEFEITPDCLIPRPETELLVERAVEFLRNREGKQLVFEMCTGSGCIAVAIAKNVASVDIIATDISQAALKVASKNVEKHQVKNKMKMMCGDLFDPIIPQLDESKFDLIVSNPPYVSSSEFESLERNVKEYEPSQALLAGVDGLDVYRKIVEKVDDFLKPDACLMLEIGHNQGAVVREMLERVGCFNEVKIEKDFSCNDRIAIARKVSSTAN